MRTLCWGKNPWGVRRLLTHINHLPRDSAYARSLSGPLAYWSESVEMQARTVEALDRLTFYFLKVNGNEVPAPVPILRPGERPVEPETVSLSQLNSFLKG